MRLLECILYVHTYVFTGICVYVAKHCDAFIVKPAMGVIANGHSLEAKFAYVAQNDSLCLNPTLKNVISISFCMQFFR